MIELKNSKLTQIGERRFALDSSIQALQMRGEGEEWQDINPQLVKVGNKWFSQGTPYRIEIDGQGGRKIYPDRQDLTKYLNLPAIDLFRNLPKRIEGNTIVASAPEFDVRFILRNSGIHFEVLIKEPIAFDRITLDADSVGLDILKLLAAKTGMDIPRPRLVDSTTPFPIERWLDWSYSAGQLELGFDLTGLKFPVLLKNTTLDLSVAASADDDIVQRQPTTVWLNSGTQLAAGYILTDYYAYGCGMRFTGVNIPAGADLTTSPNSYLTFVCSTSYSATVVRTDLCCENSNNPAQIGSYADHIGRTRTADIDWDGIAAWTAGTSYNSLDISSAIQTVVDDQAGTGNALIVFWEDKDHRSDHLDYRTRYIASWDNTTYNPPAIHIEYSAGGTAWTLFPTDSITIVDSISKGFGASKADSMTLADSFDRTANFVRANTDTMAITDALIKGLGLTEADSVSLIDSLSKLISLGKSDTLTIADAFNKSIGKISSDSVSISDSLTKNYGIPKSDSVSIVDSISKSFGLSLSDSLILVDVLGYLLISRYKVNPIEAWGTAMSKTARYGTSPTTTWGSDVSKSGRYGSKE